MRRETNSVNQDTVGILTDAVKDPIEALEREFVLPSASSSVDGHLQQEQKVLLRQSLRVGELRLLVPQGAGREVTSLPSLSRIPNTASWLKGMANVRGGLVPVVDLAEAIGVERDKSARQYLLVFGHGEEAIGLLIDGLPRSQNIQTENRLSTLPPIPATLGGCIARAYDQDSHVWLDVTISKLFERLGEQTSRS